VNAGDVDNTKPVDGGNTGFMEIELSIEGKAELIEKLDWVLNGINKVRRYDARDLVIMQFVVAGWVRQRVISCRERICSEENGAMLGRIGSNTPMKSLINA